MAACSSDNNKIDELFLDYTGNVPGASIMVIKDGKKILEKNYGLANVEEEIPITSVTNFRLASVTKQFTAMCIMMLIEKGKMKFESTLTDIFDDFPDYGKQITIKHLLQHTSGLIDYEDLIPDNSTVQVLDTDVLNMMKGQDSTYFPPGSRYRYSNSAYAVLAMIIEKISGISFAQFLKENIFLPLEMNNTVAFEKGISIVNNRAYGYAVQSDSFIFKDQSLTSAVLGDGGIYSSITDLYKWDQSLYTDKLVTDGSIELAFTRGILDTGEKIDYGLGWHLMDYKGKRCVYHTGSTCGFRNIIQRFPEEKLTIIILTNRDEPELKNLGSRIAEMFL